MDLVGRHRRPIRIPSRALAHPVVIGPRIDRWVPDARRGLRSDLHAEGEWIGLEPELAVGADDLELVQLARADAGHEQLPDARCAHRAHRHEPAIPAVEVTDDADAPCVGSPHCEADAGDALVLPRMGAEHVVQPLVRALAHEVQVDLANGRAEPIRVVALPGVAIGEGEAHAVGELPRREVGDEARP